MKGFFLELMTANKQKGGKAEARSIGSWKDEMAWQEVGRVQGASAFDLRIISIANISHNAAHSFVDDIVLRGMIELQR